MHMYKLIILVVFENCITLLKCLHPYPVKRSSVLLCQGEVRLISHEVFSISLKIHKGSPQVKTHIV